MGEHLRHLLSEKLLQATRGLKLVAAKILLAELHFLTWSHWITNYLEGPPDMVPSDIELSGGTVPPDNHILSK